MHTVSDVTIGSHKRGKTVFMTVQIPREIDIDAARKRLAGLPWADKNIRMKKGVPGRILLVEPYRPAEDAKQFEKHAFSIAKKLGGLDGFSGRIIVFYTGS